MNYRMIEAAPKVYVECLPGGGQIASERDALDLVSICGENGASRALLYGENLAPDFYNLKTGLAGDVLLKFSNYSIKVALVLAPAQMTEGRFGEMALEANRWNRQFHAFTERGKAQEWLVGD